MPTNLFEQKNSFRLVDVNGVLLSNPNDYIVINDPDGFGDMKIVLERGKKSHGFNYEFGEEEKTYGFDRVTYTGELYSSYELVKALYESDQVDAECVLQYLENGSIEHSSILDFEEFEEVDEKIKIKTRRVNFGDLFRTRFDTIVRSDDSESIDGDPVFTPASQTMFFHGKNIFSESKSLTEKLIFTNLVNEPASIFTDDVDPILKNVVDGITYVSGDKSFIETSGINADYEAIGIPGLPIGKWFAFESFNAMNREDYSYIAKIKTSIRVIIDNTSNIADSVLYTSFGHGVVDFGGDNRELLENSYAQIIETSIGDVKTVIIDIENTVDIIRNVVGKNISLLFFAGNPFGQFAIISLEILSHSVSFVRTSSSSTAQVYDQVDLMRHCLNVTTGISNPIDSDLLNIELNDIKVTNGYKLRNIDTSESEVNDSLSYSFKELYEGWLKPCFGAGYQIYNSSGNDKILIARQEHFYQDNEIDFIENVISESFSLTVDKKSFFNEIEVGSKKFPSSTDENKAKNIDEFNTVHKLSSLIKRVKNKFSELCNTIISGFLIENQRIEQYKKNPQQTVSHDKDLFAATSKSITSYEVPASPENRAIIIGTVLLEFNYIQIPGTYYDIRPGDTITVTGFDPSVDGDYEILSFQLIDGNMLISIPPPPVSLLAQDSPFTIDLNRSTLIAQRDEEFVSVTNVFSPETSYNIGLNPKNILYNHSQIIRSGLTKKPLDSPVKIREVDLNDKMSFQFKPGEGQYILNNGYSDVMTMGRDVEQQEMATPIFTGEYVKWKSNISYTRVKNIRNKCMNQDPLNNFGYVRVLEYKVFLDKIKYNPLSEEVSFEGRVKYDQ